MTTMTPAQLYKFGFLLRCAEEALTEEQTRERMQTALRRQEKYAGDGLFSATTNLIGALGRLGLAGSIMTGVGLGIGGGSLVASAMHPEVSESELKRQEILSQLQLSTQRLKSIAAQNKLRTGIR